jgi:hypothetical protein
MLKNLGWVNNLNCISPSCCLPAGLIIIFLEGSAVKFKLASVRQMPFADREHIIRAANKQSYLIVIL